MACESLGATIAVLQSTASRWNGDPGGARLPGRHTETVAPAPGEGCDDQVHGGAPADGLVERFDIELYSEFSAK